MTIEGVDPTDIKQGWPKWNGLPVLEFALKVSRKVITRFEVHRVTTDYEGAIGIHQYSWRCWRPDDEERSLRIHNVVSGEVLHQENEGVEMLAFLVMSAWRREHEKQPSNQL